MSAHLVGPPASPPRHASLQAALESAARSSVGLTFLDARERETPLPFAALWLRAVRAAASLAALGVEPGDRVALVLPTGVDFMDSFFGVLCAGAVPVPLYPPVRLARLDEFHLRTARMLQACGARLVLTDARVGRLLGLAVEEARPALGCRNVADLRAPAVETGRIHRGASDELALIQFSSGTTKDPKPVALTHANVIANASAIDGFLPEGGPVRQSGVSWLPLYHDMGLIGCLLLSVLHPGPLTLLPPELFLARPALWLRALSRTRATVSVAPNFAYGLCVKRVRDEEMEGVDLSSWRLALNGAEPVSTEVLGRFARRFARWGFDPDALTPVYGLSEASLAVTFSRPGRGFRALRVDASALAARGAAIPAAGETDNVEGGPIDGGPKSGGRTREIVSLGAPLPGIEVRVCDPDGATLPERAVGQVRVRGPSVMRGYFGNPRATAAALRDGWLDTGDLGFVHDGELHLCGRAKDLIILRGRNHAPQEFEDALDGLPGVRAGCSAAVGIEREGDDGEELALLVEQEGNAGGADALRALEERILERVLERTGVRAREVHLLAPGTLPRTSSGKLRRAEALRQLQEGSLLAPRAVTFLGMAREAARSMAAFARLRLRS
jgi:acyl-CoA synthetase (AMP-forming)/AMP-acid ligase II